MFNPDKPIHNEAAIFRALAIRTENPLAVRGMRELAWKGERLAHRYENACNYAWACTDSYKMGDTMIEKAIGALARDLGLCAYIQTDPRGGTVYVSPKPLDDMNYSSVGHCIFYGDEA